MTFTNGQAGMLAFLNNINDPWTAYTASLTNFAVSTTDYSRYKQIGKLVWAQWKGTLSAAPTGAIAISLPVSAHARYTTTNVVMSAAGQAIAVRTGVAVHTGTVYIASTATMSAVTENTSGGWSATVPVTWGTGDIWGFDVFYEAA